jgi:hypothetical protein
MPPINLNSPTLNPNQEIAPSRRSARSALAILGEQVIDEPDKQRTEQTRSYRYNCWQDIAYDFWSHFVSGVVGALAMLWWCKRPNEKS